MRLDNFTLGKYYIEILTIISRYLNKEVTGAYDTPLDLRRIVEIKRKKITPTTFLVFNVTYTNNYVESCSYTFIIIDPANNKKTEIKLEYRIFDNGVVLHKMACDYFDVKSIRILTYNQANVDFDCEMIKHFTKEHHDLLYTCFQDTYKFLEEIGEIKLSA